MRVLLTVLTAAALAGPAGAQVQRRANMVGGEFTAGGRCLAEVVVDGAAELTVSGDSANLRNLSGGQPQWRRFECSSPMPANADVRVNINGRGRAQLVASPRNGGPAVVRIEDSNGGAEVYRLEFTWAGGGYQQRGNFGAQEAIAVCRDAIRQEAVNRFGTNDVNFRQIDVDNNPGRRDWVVGTIGLRRGWWRTEEHPFSCSVNLANGRVRQARIEGIGTGSASRDVQAREMDTCRSAVIGRIGGGRVDFGPMNIEDRSGNDMVRGTARSRGRDYDFSCSVNPYNGSVRNVDVRIR